MTECLYYGDMSVVSSCGWYFCYGAYSGRINMPNKEIIEEIEKIKTDSLFSLCIGINCNNCPFNKTDGCSMGSFFDSHIERLKGEITDKKEEN